MQLQEDVTILFADIVGFTRLSSGLSAAKLVNLLNDLFGRFDYLCDQMACEKVATLGDCYYCVSGCPEPDPNHAFNCVKMGLKGRGYYIRNTVHLPITCFFRSKKNGKLWGDAASYGDLL